MITHDLVTGVSVFLTVIFCSLKFYIKPVKLVSGFFKHESLTHSESSGEPVGYWELPFPSVK